MAIKKKRKVSVLKSLIRKYPLNSALKKDIKKHRLEIEEILSGKDKRLLVIVGPCSAWPSEAVLEYGERLKLLSEIVGDTIKIVMRVYTQKPRTTKGWAGAIVQPNPFVEPDVVKGAQFVRKMMIAVAELGLPLADELLFTHKQEWIGDLLSWVAIGARSTEDQEHRVFASGLSIPVGMKNTTSGNSSIGINSIISAQSAHTYYANEYEYQTNGNTYAHLVLRGGECGPNYSRKDIEKVGKEMKELHIENQAILIDTSHDNTLYRGKKDYTRQENVIKSVLQSRKNSSQVKKIVKGFLIESFIEEGNQNINRCTSETVNRNGLSITDPCMSWKETQRLIQYIATNL